MATFLGVNGFESQAPEAELVTIMLALADHRLNEAELADWVRAHLVPLP